MQKHIITTKPPHRNSGPQSPSKQWSCSLWSRILLWYLFTGTHNWEWCEVLPPLNQWLYYITYAVIYGICLPMLNNSLQALYSRVLGHGPQVSSIPLSIHPHTELSGYDARSEPGSWQYRPNLRSSRYVVSSMNQSISSHTVFHSDRPSPTLALKPLGQSTSVFWPLWSAFGSSPIVDSFLSNWGGATRSILWAKTVVFHPRLLPFLPKFPLNFPPKNV